MPRGARALFIGALALLGLGGALLAVALRERAGFQELREVWTAEDAPPASPFLIAAFPVGIAERGVPERAILVTVENWRDPVGVVHWRDGENEVAVQRRLLRVDTEPDDAGALVEGLNRALRGERFAEHRAVEFDVGDATDERRLTVVGPDGSREVFVYGVSYDGAVTPRSILVDGDKNALIGGGLWAMGAVLFVWVAALVALGGAVAQMRAKARPVTSPRSSPSEGPGGAPGPR